MPVFECSRKVQVLGSSLAMTIPALFVKVNEVKKGQEVNVIFDLEGVLVLFQFEDYEKVRKQLLRILESLEKRIIDENLDPNEEEQ